MKIKNKFINVFRLHLFNRSIRKNREQLQAVQHICQNSSGTYPYLIFGPPGTGKTSTLVEAIKQVCRFTNVLAYFFFLLLLFLVVFF